MLAINKRSLQGIEFYLSSYAQDEALSIRAEQRADDFKRVQSTKRGHVQPDESLWQGVASRAGMLALPGIAGYQRRGGVTCAQDSAR